MPNQLSQRLDVASQASAACQQIIDALAKLNTLAERQVYLGGFNDADFVNTSLAYLSAGTIGVLFASVVPNLQANYEDAANSGRNKQILNQVASVV